MSIPSPARGGAPVGFLDELAPIEASAVTYLRRWCDGPDAQRQVAHDFTLALGPARGKDVLRSFQSLCELCGRHGRRPLMRHHVACKCLGADESCFANFIGYASEGASEDALLIATVLVRPDMAPLLVGLAQDFGMALRSMTLDAAPSSPITQTLH